LASAFSIELPSFDTGEYQGCELQMSDGKAALTVHVFGRAPIRIGFALVRWHRFTSLYACPADWVSGYYFKVGVVAKSQELEDYLRSDLAFAKPYTELHHFRIVLDESGCHEFLAGSASAL
jgi:hypothetical protein